MLFSSEFVESITGAIPPSLAVLVFLFSYLGSIYVIGPGVIVAYLRGERERTATWLGVVIAAYALFVFLKPLTDVPRPDAQPPLAREAVPAMLVPLYDLAVDFDTGSFPSGHAIATTVFWGLIVRDLNVSTFRRRLAAGIVITLLASTARVALGVHYVGDIVGGILLGLGLLAVAFVTRARVADPAVAMLGLAVVPVAGAAAIGEVADAAVLLATIAVAFLVHATIGEETPSIPTIRD